MLLERLYHWSPADRHDAIAREGLRPFSNPTVCSGDQRAPYICLGFSPAGAWGLSAGSLDEGEHDQWDLWEVVLADQDDIRVRPDFGRRLREVKVYGPIPPDRLWHVGRRHVAVFVDA